MFNDLCVGKTGTLTSARLKIKKFQIGNSYQAVNDADDWVNKDGMTEMIKSTIVESIIALSDVRLVPNDDAQYEPRGSPLETGMI